MMRESATATSLAPSIGASLDDLLASQVLPRLWLARTWAVCELPGHFARCAQDLAPDLAWRAYGDPTRPLFVLARAHQPEPGLKGHRALHVYFLDGRAVVHCAGVWAFDDRHGWRNADAADG
jgi:hypothetical protein